MGSCPHAGKRFLHFLQIENTAYLCCKPIGTTMFVRERGWLPLFHSPSISKLDLVICFRSWHCAFWMGYPILKVVIKMDVKQMGEYYYFTIVFIEDILLHWLKWNLSKMFMRFSISTGASRDLNHHESQYKNALAKPPQENMGQLNYCKDTELWKGMKQNRYPYTINSKLENEISSYPNSLQSWTSWTT